MFFTVGIFYFDILSVNPGRRRRLARGRFSFQVGTGWWSPP
jgi:hypothetical protein